MRPFGCRGGLQLIIIASDVKGSAFISVGALGTKRQMEFLLNFIQNIELHKMHLRSCSVVQIIGEESGPIPWEQ